MNRNSNDIERLKAKGMVKNTPLVWGNFPDEKARNIQHPEEDIQRACFAWFKFAWPAYRLRIFHVPNGGQRNRIVAAKLKGQGTLSGVWDIFLSVPRHTFSGMFIEIKSGKNEVTKNQLEFFLANEQDYYMKVCRSLEEFIKEVDKYLK